MNVARNDHEPTFRASGARLTFFHLLWFVTALAAGAIAFTLASQTNIIGRIGLAIASAIGGFLLAVIIVTWLVSTIGISPGTYWYHEGDIYMRSLFGSKWIESGEKKEDG